MKKVVSPRSMQRLATATAKWVLPQPLGPVKTSQPRGASANSTAAVMAWRKRWPLAASGRGPSNLVLAKVMRLSGPRLL